MIPVTACISIDESEIEVTFVRASGPGGQHVNKVSTAVQLRFDVRNSPSLSEPVKARLGKLAGGRITDDGVLLIDARESRSQAANRDAAMKRLIDLIRAAARPVKRRKPTKPTAASRVKRLSNKRTRSATKRLRRPPAEED